MAAYRAALAALPNGEGFVENLGSALSNRGVQLLQEDRDTAGAAAAFSAALEADKNQADAKRHLAALLMRQRQQEAGEQ